MQSLITIFICAYCNVIVKNSGNHDNFQLLVVDEFQTKSIIQIDENVKILLEIKNGNQQSEIIPLKETGILDMNWLIRVINYFYPITIVDKQTKYILSSPLKMTPSGPQYHLNFIWYKVFKLVIDITDCINIPNLRELNLDLQNIIQIKFDEYQDRFITQVGLYNLLKKHMSPESLSELSKLYIECKKIITVVKKQFKASGKKQKKFYGLLSFINGKILSFCNMVTEEIKETEKVQYNTDTSGISELETREKDNVAERNRIRNFL